MRDRQARRDKVGRVTGDMVRPWASDGGKWWGTRHLQSPCLSHAGSPRVKALHKAAQAISSSRPHSSRLLFFLSFS